MAKCNSCHADIWWAYTESGKSIPINRKPDPNGTVSVDTAGVVEIITDPLERDRLGRMGRRFFTAHFATCPNADQHRRRKA